MRQAENKVKIEGILSEVDIKKGSFVKNGKTVESIGGVIKIKVSQEISGNTVDLEVPVHMFSTKFTNSGTNNPAYDSIERVMTEYTSIAAAGGEDGADRVRITAGQISMNEYYGQNGLVSYPRITASFVNKIKKEDCTPEATFSVEFVVASKDYEVDADGVETDKYKIQAILPQYGDKVDLVPFYALSNGVIDAISSYWNEADTVKAVGKLNFSSKSEKYMKTVDFGDPIPDYRTVNISELIITGGTQFPLEGEFAFNSDDIRKALAERKVRLENSKNKTKAKKPTPAPSLAASANDLGF